jgi:TonB family protein
MRSAAVSLLAAFVLSACGGKDQPPPSSAGDVKHDEGDAGELSKVDEAAWADAGLDLSLAKANPDAGAPPPAASAEPAKTAAAPAAADSDECTPVGVDFEKRARPQLKECYREGKKKNPNLEGTVRVTVSIDYKGKIKNIKITEKTLPDPVAQCMLKVVKTTPFPEASKCPDKNITIPMTFPTPH